EDRLVLEVQLAAEIDLIHRAELEPAGEAQQLPDLLRRRNGKPAGELLVLRLGQPRMERDRELFAVLILEPLVPDGLDDLLRAHPSPPRLLLPVWKGPFLHPGRLSAHAGGVASGARIVVECDGGQAEAVAAWLRQAMVDGMAPRIEPAPTILEVLPGAPRESPSAAEHGNFL